MSNTSEQTTDPNKPAKPDGFTPWYTVLTGVFFLLVWLSTELDRIFKLSILLVPFLALPGLVLAAILITSLGVNAFKRRWRRVISILVAPIIAWSLFSALDLVGVTTQRIRLELWKSDYLAQVAALPASEDGIRLKTWNWGDTGGGAAPNFFWTLVYDESDQIALPPSLWSAEWVQKTGQVGSPLYSVVHNRRDGMDYYVNVKHLDGHFYVVEELHP